MSNKALVQKAIVEVFVNRDITAFDRYFDANYKQHNPQIPNGLEPLKAMIPNLPAHFKYEPGIATEDEDFVMIHGRYEGWAEKPLIAVDIFKVANGKIVEHWDVMQEEVTADKSANGNAMFPITI
jgi:predicted SnoaL-like aldol condensation-catalyzing enzyme